ncbi:hypothetical protein, partial [Klebsiella pneumoniae]|uniref:hypothetical protein n=1 Tax=Klebsiella pneumoniae TaxID=573 RepID=UPI003EDE9A8E
IRTWPAGWLSSDNSRNQYFVGRVDPLAGTPGVAPGFSIYYYDPSSGSDDYVGGTEVFDFATYASVANSNSRFPFTQAVLAANGRSNWLGNANIRNVFTPYVYNSGPGKIIA